MKWYHDGYWKDWFTPNGVYGSSDFLAGGNWFESGNVAIVHSHLWYAACCLGALEAAWDTAAVPSYDGVITAKLHADTFGIMKSSKVPDAAFEVYTYMLGPAAEELAAIYGGMPARVSLQQTYVDEVLSARDFGVTPGADINWQVIVDSLSYPDSPSHEAGMPSFLEASDRYNQYTQLMEQDPEFDVEAEAAKLVTDLQVIFDAAGD
jgi:multiple sugar transport system substrate-binding protein